MIGRLITAEFEKEQPKSEVSFLNRTGNIPTSPRKKWKKDRKESSNSPDLFPQHSTGLYSDQILAAKAKVLRG